MDDFAPRPKAVLLVGASGSGKTVVGRRTSERAGWEFIDTDAYVLDRTSAARISDVFASRGEAYFRQLERECVSDIARVSTPKVVATGGGLPAIPGMMDRLNQLGLTVYLKASVDVLWRRLQMDPRELADRPLLKIEGRQALERLVSTREHVYYRAAITLDTESLSVGEVCDLLVSHLAYRGEQPAPPMQSPDT